MNRPPPFPDAEEVLVNLLDGIGGGYACTALPDEKEFDAKIPIIVCNRIGGGSSDGITDNALCGVLVIHKTRGKAWVLAGEVRDAILSAGNTRVGGVLIDTTSETTGNQEVADIDPDNRMVDSSFYLNFRRPRS
ncbi:hypothetical protein PXH69_24170 [Rhodococcus qingshengii]|uniref:DUF3168 domain-containing protein n=1 Tax=Rhodococcus qingshengii TaxID=334542 RepID=A0AAW6LM57_RHOSG|nr:hypothetical protein [Rhodococcus qingshengii]MDE8648079.1 hypothetical protein [Rhodococcus qingshengii]